MNTRTSPAAKSRVPCLNRLLHLGVLLSLCGNAQADDWLSLERYTYQLREDEGAVRIGLVRSGDGLSAVTVEYATRDVWTIPGEDYVPTTGTLEFAAGEQVEFVTVPILNDAVAEDAEEFSLQFSNPKGARFEPSSPELRARVLIQDNDQDLGVGFESASYWVMAHEGALTVRVFRNNDLDHSAFTVDYSTHDGTALAGQDYVGTAGTLAFAPGELVQPVTIPVMGDGSGGWDTEFTITLRNPSDGAFLGTNATATIQYIAPFVPNPLLPEMMGHVQSGDLTGLMRRITGEEPVLVGGDVRTIISRHTTSATLHQATQLAFEQFMALGLETSYRPWNALVGSGEPIADRNVIGIRAGRSRPEEIVVVGAHFDSMPADGPAPGADDNASGSAAVMVAARILSQYEFARTLHFALFTGEEQHLLGSAGYAEVARTGGSNIVAALLPDMIGFHAAGLPSCHVFARTDTTGVTVWSFGIPIRFSYPNDVNIASVFTNVIARCGLADDLFPLMGRPTDNLWVGSISDHGSFWGAGFPAIWIKEDPGAADPEGHTTNDVLSTLNTEYFTAMVKAIVGTAAHLAHPIGRKPLDIIEVANSDWTPGRGIGGGVFHAKHQEGASESDGDPRDLAWSNAQTTSNQKWLRVQTEPHGVALQTDARPASSETMFQAKLLGGDTTGAGLSCSNQLRFSFLTPPDPNRVYLARIHVDGRYVQSSVDFDCVTNLQAVVAGGGFLQLPNLTNLPNGAVYGTCDIAARFLNTEPANCRLRITGVSERAVALAATAQLGVYIIDDLDVSTNLASGNDWALVESYTNNVSPDAANFDAGWTEIARDVDPSRLPAAGTQFFRLRRTWIHP